MLTPVEVRRIHQIIAAVYCVAAPTDDRGATVVRVLPHATTGSPTTIPPTAERGTRGVLTSRLVQLPR